VPLGSRVRGGTLFDETSTSISFDNRSRSPAPYDIFADDIFVDYERMPRVSPTESRVAERKSNEKGRSRALSILACCAIMRAIERNAAEGNLGYQYRAHGITTPEYVTYVESSSELSG
jgi:hypothetical protein